MIVVAVSSFNWSLQHVLAWRLRGQAWTANIIYRTNCDQKKPLKASYVGKLYCLVKKYVVAQLWNEFLVFKTWKKAGFYQHLFLLNTNKPTLESKETNIYRELSTVTDDMINILEHFEKKLEQHKGDSSNKISQVETCLTTTLDELVQYIFPMKFQHIPIKKK